MTDIVDRLTAEWPDVKDAQDGAKEIIKLREKVEKLTEVLKPFVEAAKSLEHPRSLWRDYETHWHVDDHLKEITVGDLRRAKEVYENTK